MMYTKESLAEYFAAREALEAVPQGEDYIAERERLSRAEDALMAQGWRNLENEEELRKLRKAAK